VRALAGAADDLTAAREHGLIEALSRRNVMTFADKGLPGRRRHHLKPVQAAAAASAAVAAAEAGQPRPRPHPRARRTRRYDVEDLEGPDQLRCCSRRATAIVQAILTLQAVEDARHRG
jgi:hypothetical protein